MIQHPYWSSWHTILREKVLMFSLLSTVFFISSGVNAANIENVGYHVGIDDILTIEVYDNKDISGKYTVGVDGSILFPLVKKISVAGQTTESIQKNITKLLAADYLYDPIVSVEVTEFRSKKVKIIGYVKNPGVYYLEGQAYLFEMLAKAGGILGKQEEVVRGQHARVIRTNNKVKKIIDIDLYALIIKADAKQDILLQNGDVISIPTIGKKIHVVGEVKFPGTFIITNGMTVAKAIAIAHGVTNQGDIDGVTVRRVIDSKEVELDVTLDDELQPDDIVEVPLSFW